MWRRYQHHRLDLPSFLQKYAEARTLDYHRYSEYHMRIMDGGYTTIDIWTTGKYYVLQTDYHKLTDKRIVERGGEKGFLPSGNRLGSFLDKLFYAAEMGQSC